jgi:hypothetical protein
LNNLLFIKVIQIVVKHIGSAHTEDELTILRDEAERLREELSPQLSLFSPAVSSSRLIHMDHLSLQAVTHRFAHKVLRRCSEKCGLNFLPPLYQDIAIMRLIEPISKLRTLTLLQRYFHLSYAERTVYRLLPKLIQQKEVIENAAYETASRKDGITIRLPCPNRSFDVVCAYSSQREKNDRRQFEKQITKATMMVTR